MHAMYCTFRRAPNIHTRRAPSTHSFLNLHRHPPLRAQEPRFPRLPAPRTHPIQRHSRLPDIIPTLNITHRRSKTNSNRAPPRRLGQCLRQRLLPRSRRTGYEMRIVRVSFHGIEGGGAGGGHGAGGRGLPLVADEWRAVLLGCDDEVFLLCWWGRGVSG